MGDIKNRQNWLFGSVNSIIKDKEDLRVSYMRYMFVRTSRIFKWNDLPETIPQREIERLLQMGRYAIVKRSNTDKGDGKLYVFYGGIGGEPNEYYLPTLYTIANPYLREFSIGKLDDDITKDSDVVLGWNDSEHIGLVPMFDRYASLLSESDLTLRLRLVLSRLPSVAIGNTDDARDSFKKLYESIESGGDISAIIGDELISEQHALEVLPFNDNNKSNIKDIIEIQQYLKASWYNELGLNANYNMKRESINESESGMNEDSLLPLIDDMLEQRRIFASKINEKFGTNITVELSSSWKKIREEIKQREEKNDAEIEDLESKEQPKEDNQDENANIG